MRFLLFAVALALPAAAVATVAMEPLQATSSSQDTAQSRQAERGTHHPLFIVKYVLRRPSADEAPQIVMDDAAPQIVPPSGSGYPTAALGAAQPDPNTILCYGRGCESRQR